ncbi:hypothetical protein HF072_11155 [Bacillus sp. RO3]|nr:hypothetical protein [Bacillus sp. RO3]
MNSTLESIFFLPIWIGDWIGKRVGKGLKGIISYVVLYLIVTACLSIITDGVKSSRTNLMFHFFNTYLLLGMYYVFLHYWKRSEHKS